MRERRGGDLPQSQHTRFPAHKKKNTFSRKKEICRNLSTRDFLHMKKKTHSQEKKRFAAVSAHAISCT
jgi:hypothetical protein